MKECCAVVLAATHWLLHLWGNHFARFTDQALTYLFKMQDTTNVLTRWTTALQSYELTVNHVGGKFNEI